MLKRNGQRERGREGEGEGELTSLSTIILILEFNQTVRVNNSHADGFIYRDKYSVLFWV